MAWFNYLKESGYFSPDANPGPVKVDNGYHIPRWEVLSYLDKLSTEFSNGKELELVPEVLDIIKRVSEAPKDNHITWYHFIKFLTRIPNELVPISILDYLPIWMHSSFGNRVQSMEIITALLPKFIPESPTVEDIEKAEKILYYLFSIELGDEYDFNSGHYYSPVYLHFLKSTLIEDRMATQIAKHCSFSPIDRLIAQLNLILRDHPKGDEIKTDSHSYKIIISPIGNDLQVQLFTKELSIENPEENIQETIIDDYLELSEEALMNIISILLFRFGLSKENFNENSSSWKRVRNQLSSDLVSAFGNLHIEDAHDKLMDDDNLLEVFTLLLRDLLQAYISEKPSESEKYLRKLLKNEKYNLPFLKRMVLYLIAVNHGSFLTIFWDMISTDDPAGYFSMSSYHPELYLLLKTIAEKLSEKEQSILNVIIENGPTGNSGETEYPLQWKHRWLDALTQNPFFKVKHEELTKELGYTKEIDYASEGKIRISKGYSSPLTTEEILDMDDEELVSQLISFKSTGDFDAPSPEGLSDTLQAAAEQQPEKIIRLLPRLTNLAIVYRINLYYAFTAAWRAGKDFDWAPLLEFSEITLSQKEEDATPVPGKRSTPSREWLYLSMARTMSEGMKSDKHAFPVALLPQAKRIVVALVQLTPQSNKKPSVDYDYPMHLANSGEGTVLRALMDYALRVARVRGKDLPEPRWSSDIPQIFDSAFEKKRIDAYILLGMYLPQLMFLDSNWVLSRIRKIYDGEDQYYRAFMGGIEFGQPPSTTELYQAMQPHYLRAIRFGTALKSRYNQGLARHIVLMNLWGLEEIDHENSILAKFISDGELKTLNEISQYLRIIYDEIAKMDCIKSGEIKAKVIRIWVHLVNRAGKAESKDEQELLAHLSYLIEYVDVLNEETTHLAILSGKYAESYHYLHELLEQLNRLTSTSAPSFIGHIIAEFSFTQFSYHLDEEPLIQLVKFLYENGQEQVANNICNRITMEGHEFLIKVYQEYNN